MTSVKKKPPYRVAVTDKSLWEYENDVGYIVSMPDKSSKIKELGRLKDAIRDEWPAVFDTWKLYRHIRQYGDGTLQMTLEDYKAGRFGRIDSTIPFEERYKVIDSYDCGDLKVKNHDNGDVTVTVCGRSFLCDKIDRSLLSEVLTTDEIEAAIEGREKEIEESNKYGYDIRSEENWVLDVLFWKAAKNKDTNRMQWNDNADRLCELLTAINTERERLVRLVSKYGDTSAISSPDGQLSTGGKEMPQDGENGGDERNMKRPVGWVSEGLWKKIVGTGCYTEGFMVKYRGYIVQRLNEVYRSNKDREISAFAKYWGIDKGSLTSACNKWKYGNYKKDETSSIFEDIIKKYK